MKKAVLVFPGQGEQHAGMGKELYESFSEARDIFQEADEILSRPLSQLMFNGSLEELTQTSNSQPAIFVHSIAALRVLQKQFPSLEVMGTGGHSLGEYAAAVAAGVFSFQDALSMVQERARCMASACTQVQGKMAAVLGLSDEKIHELQEEVAMPKDLWVANYNCPGQVVLSGTEKGIAKAVEIAKKLGAKRALPLQVQGAFHSGLMQPAEEAYAPTVLASNPVNPQCLFVMNVVGKAVANEDEIKSNLVKQITHSVRWVECVRSLATAQPDLFIEVGPGKTLSGLHRRIEPSFAIERLGLPSNLDQLGAHLG